MARRSNPFFTAPSGDYAAVGQGVSNLASAFLNTPDPATRAKTEALAWQARGARQEQEMNLQNRQENERLANLFELYDQETYDPRQVMSTAIRSNMAPDDISQLFLAASGNLQGMTDEQRTGSLVGTGKTLGENEAVSVAHQDRIRQENQKADMGGLSRDELLANIFLTEGPEAANQARPILFNPPAAPTDTTWLNRARQAEIEADIVAELDNLPYDLGLPEGTAVPPELRGHVMPRAMSLVREGLAPREAVGQVLQGINARASDPAWYQFLADPELQYDIPAGGSPAPAPQRSVSDVPVTNEKGWVLQVDANGNRAYVSPDGSEYEEVR